jgi:hypothetical protein
MGTDIDSDPAIRWLIALIVLCHDALAITLTPRLRHGHQPLAKTTFGPQRLRSKFSSVA